MDYHDFIIITFIVFIILSKKLFTTKTIILDILLFIMYLI